MVLVQSFSGIRGVYPAEINETVVQKYAAAFLTLFSKKPKLVAGCDTRSSSAALKQAIIAALPDVIDLGVAPTPTISFAVRQYNADGGIIITASHNEPEYNGLKLLRKDGGVLRPDDMQKVIATYQQGNLVSTKNQKVVDKHTHALDMYLHYVLNVTRNQMVDEIRKKKFTIVTDPGGGAAATVLDEICKWLHVENVQVNYELGKFNRVIEPKKESLGALPKIIGEKKALFAAAFDCDADRLEIMLLDGSLVDGNQILALLVDEVLMAEKGIVVVNDATSGLVRQIAANHEAELHEVEVGEVNVVAGMLLHNSPIGGEGSNGGVIIPPSTVRDGILALCFILRILARTDKSIEELIDTLPKYYTFADKITIKAEDVPKIRKKLAEKFSGQTIQYTGDETGGMKILFDDGFLWFRQSKTEAGVFRIIADGRDEKKVRELLEKGKEYLVKLL